MKFFLSLIALFLSLFPSILAQSHHDGYLIQLNGRQHFTEFQKNYPLAEAISWNDFIVKIDRLPNLDSLYSVKSVNWHQINRYVYPRNTTVNDPFISLQWPILSNQMNEVWEVAKGDITVLNDQIVVGIMDNGFDLRHEDLTSYWVNPHESLNGIDDDGNGFVDDINGWDFVNRSREISVNDHGTSVTGIISGTHNNNIGISGLGQPITYLPTVIAPLNSIPATESLIIQAYDYYIHLRKRYNETNGAQGAYVVAVNLSFGISFTFEEDTPLWCKMYDRLGEVGILAISSTSNDDYNVDLYGDIPSNCKSPYLIITGNQDEFGNRKQSGFGVSSVDLTAPGENIVTTNSDNDYGYFNGTSISAPHVTATVALIYSNLSENEISLSYSNPSLIANLVKNTILNNVTKNSSHEGKVQSGGHLNIYNIFFNNNSKVKPIALQVFPNPSDGNFYFTHSLEGSYTLSLTNALGINVIQIEQPSILSNEYVFQTTQGLASGMYVMTVDNGKEMQSTTIFIK